MPRKLRQPAIKAGDMVTPGAVAVPFNSGTGQFADMKRPLALSRPCWEYRVEQSENGSRWAVQDTIYFDPQLAFNVLGAEGWELVTIYSTGDGHYAPVYYAVFKREARDG